MLDVVFDGLLRKALARELTFAAKARLKAIRVDVDGRFEPLYPHPVYLQTLEILREELMPDRSIEQAFRSLGARAVLGYFDTWIGRALKQMLRALGVRRALNRMTQNFSATNNYTRAEAHDIAPKHVRLWMNELTDTRHVMAGIIEAGLSVAGGKDVRATLVETDDDGCVYEVCWS
ncbi:MAG: DUF2378 family protein [Myxococcaceae bacterium]